MKWQFLFLSLFLLCLCSSASCNKKVAEDYDGHKEITIASDDAFLVKVFNWAVGNSNMYVGADSDPVGPWYEAALPGRQAFCMRDVSHQCIGEEINGHGKQNLNIMKKFAVNISQSKDYCSYWEIDKYNRPSPADYVSDHDFWYNLNANFDVLNACYRLYLWTGNKQYIDNSEFERFFHLSANEYIDKWQLQADKIMLRPDVMNVDETIGSPKFKGRRGIPSYEESVRDLTVTGDLIATIYRGLKSYATILSLKGDQETSRKYKKEADDYLDLYNEQWWNADTQNYYAYKLVDGSLQEGGSNIFPVWYGIVTKGSRLNRLLDIIASKETNVESMSYYPMTFYRYGRNDEGYRYLKELFINKRRDYPEVASGVIEGIVCGLAGVNADAVNNTITTVPRFTNATHWVSIEQIPVFSGSVSVRHKSVTESSLLNNGSKKIIWRAAFQGKFNTINGIKATQITDGAGQVISYIELACRPGDKVNAKVDLK